MTEKYWKWKKMKWNQIKSKKTEGKGRKRGKIMEIEIKLGNVTERRRNCWNEI